MKKRASRKSEKKAGPYSETEGRAAGGREAAAISERAQQKTRKGWKREVRSRTGAASTNGGRAGGQKTQGSHSNLDGKIKDWKMGTRPFQLGQAKGWRLRGRTFRPSGCSGGRATDTPRAAKKTN